MSYYITPEVISHGVSGGTRIYRRDSAALHCSPYYITNTLYFRIAKVFVRNLDSIMNLNYGECAVVRLYYTINFAATKLFNNVEMGTC